MTNDFNQLLLLAICLNQDVPAEASGEGGFSGLLDFLDKDIGSIPST